MKVVPFATLVFRAGDSLMSSVLRPIVCAALLSLTLSACATVEEDGLLVSDLQAGPTLAVEVDIPEIENTELPYVPVVNDMNEARVQFKQGNYGLAQEHFLKVTEQRPDNVDAWLGLAACYDHLRRFDLAEGAYHKAIALVGPSSAILNNMGYSYLLQGKLIEARKKLVAAHQLDPDNPHVRANIELLREGVLRAKRNHAS